MSLPIISADERLAERRGLKIVLLGAIGVGKTSLLRTLPAASTLFIDLEAGDLAVAEWRGDALRPRTWPDFRDLAVFLAGPNPALPDTLALSQAHFDAVCERYGDPAQYDRYDTYFCDSITVLSRLCLTWAKTQPAAVSERTGKPDARGAYGLLGQEMIATLSHLQHAREKNVVFVAILDTRTDEFGRKVFAPQIEGAKTGLELPGIVDEVITLAELKDPDGASYRGCVCRTLNPWGYPAKDRSGRLDLIEPPDLGRLMAKLRAPPTTGTTPLIRTLPVTEVADEEIAP